MYFCCMENNSFEKFGELLLTVQKKHSYLMTIKLFSYIFVLSFLFLCVTALDPSAPRHVVFSRWVYVCFASHQNSFPSYGVRVSNPLLMSMLICRQPGLHNSPSVPKTMGKTAQTMGVNKRVSYFERAERQCEHSSLLSPHLSGPAS